VRVNGRVTSQATVVAVGVTSEGERPVLGIDVGPSEDRAFWTALLRRLVKRGLRGVRLVTSDAHEGLKPAIATVVRTICAAGSRDGHDAAGRSPTGSAAELPRPPHCGRTRRKTSSRSR
jgi:hypothetical protein